jgi:hypothetical protein
MFDVLCWYTSRIFVAWFPQFIPNHFIAHHKCELNPFQIHCLQLKVNILSIHWFTQPFPFDIETKKFDDYSLFFSGVANLRNFSVFKNMFLNISNNLFDLNLLLNVCYIMFVKCDIDPSFVPISDVILLKFLQITRLQLRELRINSRNFLLSYINIPLF